VKLQTKNPRMSTRGRPLTNSALRGLWLAITVLAGALTGTAGGLLAWIGGVNPPMAVLTGAGAFSGAVLLILAMLRFAAGSSD